MMFVQKTPVHSQQVSIDCLSKQLSLPPSRSFLRLNFRRILNFILLSKVTKNSINDDQTECQHLGNLIEELQTSFDAICDQEYHEFVKSCRIRHLPKPVKNLRTPARLIDKSFTLNWALFESAKYCLTQKLAPENVTTNQFLNLLKEELNKPIHCDNQISRLVLLRFLSCLDKIIIDRISESSHQKHTLNVAENVEQFINTNKDILETWLFKNRQINARAALITGDYAECWRSINLRLWCDTTTKYSALSQRCQEDTDPRQMKLSVSQTLMSLDSKHWRANLELLGMSAKYLSDTDLLYGLKSLVKHTAVLGEDWTLIDLLISNTESNYEKTLQTFSSVNQNRSDPAELDQCSLNEFLEACVELDQLSNQCDRIALLKTPSIKSLYEHTLAFIESYKLKRQTEPKCDGIRSWMSTWAFDPSNNANSAVTIKAHIDLALFAEMNNIFQINPAQQEKSLLMDTISSVVDTQSLAKLMLSLSNDNDDTLAVMSKLLNSVRENEYSLETRLDQSSTSGPTKADKHHHLLYRLSKYSGLYESTNLDRQKIDLMQSKAAKFNLKKGNKGFGIALAQELNRRNPQDVFVRLSNTLAIIDNIGSKSELLASSMEPDRLEPYLRFGSQVRSDESLSDKCKSNLLSKAFRRAWHHSSKDRQEFVRFLDIFFGNTKERSENVSNIEQEFATNIDATISKQNLPIAVMALIARNLDEELNAAMKRDRDAASTASLADISFKADLTLLMQICDANLVQNKRCMVAETTTRILNKIKEFNRTLSVSNLTMFSSATFLDKTLGRIWFGMKGNIISLLVCGSGLQSPWMEALTLIIERIAVASPESLLFETIVNRLELRNKLATEEVRTPSGDQLHEEASSLQQHIISSTEVVKSFSTTETGDCRRKLVFWDRIFDAIKNAKDTESDRWHTQVLESIAFTEEIRKISHLSGEFLRTLTIRMNRRLNQYLNLFKRYANPLTGKIVSRKHLEECHAKLDLIYKHEIKSIEVLKSHLDKSKMGSQVTIYDSSMNVKIWAGLMELEYRFKLLVEKKDANLREITSLIKSITTLLSFCHAQVNTIHQAFKQRLYMEQISPFLSRMKSDLVLMPGYFVDEASQESFNKSQLLAPVTIQKIAQNVQLIHSKTAPKKLTFIGSDGCSRAYLLKAHEDLRLDKLIMNLFGSMNMLFSGSKKTQDYNYRLQRYSVTPVSNCSGLIQWVEAPSLCSVYKTWFQSPNGRRIVGRLYKETCGFVCPDPKETDENNHKCTPPSSSQSIDLFHQLLWAKLVDWSRRTRKQRGLKDEIAKPRSENTIKYRKEFPASIYEEVVQQLVTVLPQDLIANQLWFDSPDSMGYYVRTREFTRSCATISMIGYMIGLGDRHPENILLDSRTGRVTHIDYNICFELGQKLSVPEKVPFRLTQSMIHAFGFAGLEGGFKRSCVRILELMKEYKSVILHHLDPTNLSFMVGEGASRAQLAADPDLVKMGDEVEFEQEEQAIKEVAKDSSERNLRRAMSDLSEIGAKQQPSLNKRTLEPALRSQEDDGSTASLELTASINYDSRLPGGHNSRASRGIPVQKLSHTPHEATDQPTTNQNHFDIKTPTLISPKRASDIYERVRSKLTGSDELLLMKMYASCVESGRRRSSTGHSVDSGTCGQSQANDLILLIDEVQSTEDQVDSLILEAISNKNKAAMYEGWSAWV